MAHIHSIYDTDSHFSINPITRAIKNESSTKTSIMQNDHNSERFTFELPRMIEGHDMSLCNKIEIHYINTSSENKEEFNADVYPVDDLQLSPAADDMVIFSWLVSKNATLFEGSLHFLIRFTCMTGEIVDYDWHTSIFKGIHIGEGMNNGAAVVEEYSDVLEAWKKDLVMANSGYVPLLETLDAKEEAETGRPWFTQPQNAYARVYTESTATKAPYNKTFLTDRPIAPVDPDGRAAEYGKGVYFTKARYSDTYQPYGSGVVGKTSGYKVQVRNGDNYADALSRLRATNITDGKRYWLRIQQNEGAANGDPEIWMYPSTEQNGLGDGKKVVAEFDIKMEAFKELGENYDTDWTFKISASFDGNRAITTSASNPSSLLLYMRADGVEVRINTISNPIYFYKCNPYGEIINFKLALFNKKYYVYINDYLMGAGDSVLNTDTASVFTRLGMFINTKDTISFSIANVFCGVVDGEDELSGRYLGSIPVRRQNRHILVPDRLSDYKACKLDRLDPKEYSLSYGAALELFEIIEKKISLLLEEITASDGTMGLRYTISDDGLSYALSGVSSDFTAKEVFIGNYLNGKPVLSVNDHALIGRTTLKNVIISGTVISIGNSAFSSCDSLMSVTIPNSVVSIGTYAFSYCGSIRSVTIPNSVKSIGAGAFSNCYSLINVTIPDSITTIADNTFYNCESLASITIPKNVKSIKSSAFAGCTNLTDINICLPKDSIPGAPWGATNATINWNYEG